MRGARLVTLALAVFAVAATVHAQPSRTELKAHRALKPPVIDGFLNDDEWQRDALPAEEWLSYNPLYGDQVPQKTAVWVSYDADYLYFAFRCDDPDPSSIKTSITRRDNIWQDDWIGLSLDALGTGQLSYHMLVNPSGVQLDAHNSASGREDTAPDWIWDSAGRVTATGYAVEIRLPLQSIRFKGGVDAQMGILFWRRVSRLGVSVSWPALAPGVWVFERHAPLRFDDIRPRTARELLPSATYARNQTRDSPARWLAPDGMADVGFSAKVGVSPTVTLDATVNPDFSQVESDAFQVEVNQRFPIFFDEKRPFFMEGAGLFSLAGAGGDNSLRTAVHTRRIVDPAFGAKLTGSLGRVTFGTLTAVDDSPPEVITGVASDDRIFNIGRVQYNLSPSNFVGAIATDMSSDGGYNRVVGSDLKWRFTPTQRVEGFVLGSHSREPDAVDATSGVGGQVTYRYETQRWLAAAGAEHYDEDFQMATAFLNRVGITSSSLFLDRSFYPSKTRYPWIRRLAVVGFVQGGEDRLAGGNDLLGMTGLRFNFTRQGFLRVDRLFGFERWRGERFERGRFRAFGNVQLFRWLRLEGNVSGGLAVLYDAFDPLQGRSRDTNAGVTLQPNGRLSQSLDYNRVAFDDEATGARLFTVNILNSRTTYQFTRAFSLRAVAQYASSRTQVLMDFLSSFEPRPGTVLYVGYGSLLERRQDVDGRWVEGQGPFETTRRGLFLKASYLYRF